MKKILSVVIGIFILGSVFSQDSFLRPILVYEVYGSHCYHSSLCSLLPGGLPVAGIFQYLAQGDPELYPICLNHCSESIFCIPEIDESVYRQKVCFCCNNRSGGTCFYWTIVPNTGP